MERLDAITDEIKRLLQVDDLAEVRAGLALCDEADVLLTDNRDRALRIRSHLLSQLALCLVSAGRVDEGYRLFHALLAWDLSRNVWETNLDREPRDRHLGRCLDRCPGFVQWVEGLDADPELPDEAVAFVAARPANLDRLFLLQSGCRLQARLSPGWPDTLAPGRRARMALLRRWGADLHATKSGGSGAVHHVAVLQDIDTLRFLVERGLDVDARDDSGDTPLMAVAGRKGCGDTLRALVGLGADVNATNERGRTALFGAAYGADTSVIEALVELGADLEHEEGPGYTALEMAARSSNHATAEALLAAGAIPTMEAWKSAKEQNYMEMASRLHAAIEARAPGTLGAPEGLDPVARRLGEQAAEWARDSGEYKEYMAEGPDGGELIVEQYWEAHFEGQAREALKVATSEARGALDAEAWLARMKETYRHVFFEVVA